MLVIKNTSKSVKVLKTIGEKSLRLFPGFNTIPETVDYESFFKGNKAAQGMAKECLKRVDEDGLTTDELKLAKAARDKNDKLNAAQQVITAAKEDKAKDTKTIATQEAAIEELRKQMAEQDKVIADLLEGSKKKRKKKKPKTEPVADANKPEED